MKILYDKAVKRLEYGELDEAEDALHTYLKENPTDAMAHNKLKEEHNIQDWLIKNYGINYVNKGNRNG